MSAPHDAPVAGPHPPLPVLAEEPGWIAVDKPSGLACHRSALCPDRDTLHARALSQLGGPLHLVHRLDRPTSGVLLLARDPDTTTRLSTALRHPRTDKVYVAMVRGFFQWDDPVEVDRPLKDPDGKVQEARSVIDVLGRSHAPRCSLVRIRPRTGRWHQVRRHVRGCDHPVLGDTAHGDSRRNIAWREAHGLDRLALHCHRVALHLGDDEDPVVITSPLSGTLRKVAEAMPWWGDAVGRLPTLATS